MRRSSSSSSAGQNSPQMFRFSDRSGFVSFRSFESQQAEEEGEPHHPNRPRGIFQRPVGGRWGLGESLLARLAGASCSKNWASLHHRKSRHIWDPCHLMLFDKVLWQRNCDRPGVRWRSKDLGRQSDESLLVAILRRFRPSSVNGQ